MSPFEFAIYCLATYRITRLINHDSGPAMLFERIRYRFGVRRDFEDVQIARDGSVARLLICHACFSFAPAGCWALAAALFGPRAAWAALPFAIWAVSIIIYRVMGE